MSSETADAWVAMPSEEQIRSILPGGHPYDFGFITGMQRLLMAHPRIAAHFGALFRQIMFEPGALGRDEREMVAAVAAAVQDCRY
jgi:alkylhydroperoxidase/carboxymuconolactone decarboxylase family protein YurZ